MKSREIDEYRDPSMGHPKERDREAEKKAMLNRMARAIGHMEAVKRMMEDDKDPSEVLIQLAAVRSAITGLSRRILQEHIETALEEAKDHPESDEDLEDLKKVISYFVK